MISDTMSTGVINDDQNKRTMEALERRFALAKAEMQQRDQKNNIKHLQQEKPSGTGPRSAFSSMAMASDKSSASRKDLEPDDPIYLPISQPIDENLIIAAPEVCSKGKNGVDRVLHELLQGGDSAQKYMQGSKSIKMDNYILLDNFVSSRSKSASRLNAVRSQSKRSRKHMSMRQLKKIGSLDLPDKFAKFDLFMPMHDMWKDYLIQLLKSIGKNQIAQRLVDADLHGAILRVVACNVDALIGIVGIMIRETAETLGIVTQDDKFKVVPKIGSVFILQADCWKVTLHGDKLASRNMCS